MGRVLSIFLPQLPLDLYIRKGDARTAELFAVITEVKNAWRLRDLSPAARSAGLTPGLSLPDARAICPDLTTAPGDAEREAQFLRVLARWADCLSPKVGCAPPDGLSLDITGCAHLFGGEAAMAAHSRDRLADMMVSARIGIADTKGAAWALARFGEGPVTIAPAGETQTTLQALPVEGLDITGKLAQDMRRAGLKTIGQLYDIKPAELGRRFGLELNNALSAAVGQRPDPVAPQAAVPVYAARMTLPEPIGMQDDLRDVLGRLARAVCKRLTADGSGARRFYLTVRCVDTGDHVMRAGFARPCFTPQAVVQQFAHPLDTLKIEYGADWFRLWAEQVEPLKPQQRRLTEAAQEADGADSAQIISTLGNRLGFDRVRKFIPMESHLPEREFKTVEAIDVKVLARWQPPPRQRPLRLFPRPEYAEIIEAGRPPKRFRWRKTSYETKSAHGPERLSDEWWQVKAGGGSDRFSYPLTGTRDYWRVQTAEGPRLWLLTYPACARGEWYVAGRFP